MTSLSRARVVTMTFEKLIAIRCDECGRFIAIIPVIPGEDYDIDKMNAAHSVYCPKCVFELH